MKETKSPVIMGSTSRKSSGSSSGRINHEIALQRNFAALDQERKRKARGNAESFLAVVAAARKRHLQLSAGRVLRATYVK